MKVKIKIGDLVEKIGMDKSIKVKTPLGYKSILDTMKTEPEKKFHIETENGFYLDCADKHRVETESGWKFVKDIKVKEKIRTVGGFEKASVVKDLNTVEEMYDIQVEETESYWSNGIHSHNSEICKQIAEQNGCVYHKLEIQKIPLEEFEGFPYLEDRDGRKVVRLAQPTVLPPSEDKGLWMLHLDEFNKADSDKMAAVMNLVLTGEIGGTADFNLETGKSEKYRLPERTIIVGSGNFKMQENTENLNIVNQMDIATSERFHRAVNLDYNSRSWLENFATKSYTFRFNGDSFSVSSRIPSIILNYIMDKMLEENNRAPFLIPISFKPDEGGSERTTSPRAWTLIADNMFLDAVAEFIELEDGNEYEKYGDDAFNAYMQNPSNQIRILAEQAAEFGLGGEGIVNDIIARYIYFAENRLLPQDILYNYKDRPDVRKKAKKLKKKIGANLRLLLSVADYVNNEGVENDHIEKSCLFVSTYIEDVEVPAEDLTAFIHILLNSKNKSAQKFHKTLQSLSRRYKISCGDFYYTSEKDIEKSINESKKKLDDKE